MCENVILVYFYSDPIFGSETKFIISILIYFYSLMKKIKC